MLSVLIKQYDDAISIFMAVTIVATVRRLSGAGESMAAVVLAVACMAQILCAVAWRRLQVPQKHQRVRSTLLLSTPRLEPDPPHTFFVYWN